MIRSIWDFKGSKEQTSTRVHAEELRHEYRMVTRYLRDLENDFLVGKVSQADYASMRQTYRERAMRLLAQLDQSVPVEQHIAADLASRRLTTPSAVGGIS